MSSRAFLILANKPQYVFLFLRLAGQYIQISLPYIYIYIYAGMIHRIHVYQGSVTKNLFVDNFLGPGSSYKIRAAVLDITEGWLTVSLAAFL